MLDPFEKLIIIKRYLQRNFSESLFRFLPVSIVHNYERRRFGLNSNLDSPFIRHLQSLNSRTLISIQKLRKNGQRFGLLNLLMSWRALYSTSPLSMTWSKQSALIG